MPTDNPKISAYVPQAVYDRFKQYQDESGLSMSQAAINIFAQFLGVEIETPGDLTKVGGVTPEKLQDLTQEVEGLKTKLEEVLGKVDYLYSTKELQGDIEEVEQEESEGELPNPVIDEREIIQPEDKTDRPQLSLLGELPDELPTLSGNDLALRLGVSKSRPSTMKTEKSLDEFIAWTREKDPDGIDWIYRAKSKGKGVDYFPASKLDSELKGKLLKWIKENIS